MLQARGYFGSFIALLGAVSPGTELGKSSAHSWDLFIGIPRPEDVDPV